MQTSLVLAPHGTPEGRAFDNRRATYFASLHGLLQAAAQALDWAVGKDTLFQITVARGTVEVLCFSASPLVDVAARVTIERSTGRETLAHDKRLVADGVYSLDEIVRACLGRRPLFSSTKPGEGSWLRPVRMLSAGAQVRECDRPMTWDPFVLARVGHALTLFSKGFGDGNEGADMEVLEETDDADRPRNTPLARFSIIAESASMAVVFAPEVDE